MYRTKRSEIIQNRTIRSMHNSQTNKGEAQGVMQINTAQELYRAEQNRLRLRRYRTTATPIQNSSYSDTDRYTHTRKFSTCREKRKKRSDGNIP